MNEWMDGPDRQMDISTNNEWTSKQTIGRMDEWMNEQMKQRMDKEMNEWTNKQINQWTNLQTNKKQTNKQCL